MNYKKLFAITRQLQRREMPDDLMQLTLEFVGDLNETRKDLRHKHLFCQIRNSVTGEKYCHYCKSCDQILMYKTSAGLRHHVKSNKHCTNTKWLTRRLSKQQTRRRVLCEFRSYFSWSSFYKNIHREMLDVVDVELKNKKSDR